MGIPKAFRWLSERYPLISQLIEEDRIPEFDNLYLDMNGIIHNCSHNNNEDVHFRITEEQIFLNVFAYIEHLFSKIKPRKLFFMAIDGVAPRAKMNQQRSRRFRAAKEINDRILEAKRKGEDIPEDDGDAFQSNMITPGTPFMARLTANLRYFINKKISEDANWRGVQVVLSGHEVPGEGEHKIMEYIRLAKAQPEYDPNTRHCLYGLDADLIMLGLLSHDPHFCLLREEVLFGPAKAKASKKGLESTNFYLMHLSLMREYLDIEFADLKEAMPADNPYDLERIIDDFILLAIFIGNDFLPHLPGLHIAEGALNLLFEIYKRIIPTAGGYLNEHGLLNTRRLQLVLDQLAEFEREKFEEEFADSSWLRVKNAGRTAQNAGNKRAKGKLSVTPTQRKLLASIKTFILSNMHEPSLEAKLELPSDLKSHDVEFLQKLGEELKLDLSFDEYDSNDEPIIVIRLSKEVVEMLLDEQAEEEDDGSASANGVDDGEEWEDVDENGHDEVANTADLVQSMHVNGKMKGHAQAQPVEQEYTGEWQEAVERIFAKYAKAPNAKEVVKSSTEHEKDYQAFVTEKMYKWKLDYYKGKLEFDISKEPKSLADMAFAYIEGIQWVLHYYYDGVASWSWYYPYHYSPKISDLVKAEDMHFDFDINTPFKPFQQLMGVLPGLSNALVPIPYRDLMLDPSSPIIDFYPLEFEQDLNGKKQDWEAIVKIPFLDADRLVKTMATRDNRLTEEERQRNSFGDSYTFIYDPAYVGSYPSSSPGFFPDLHNSHCRMEVFNLPTLGGLRLVKGLCEGALLGKDALPGFPSLHTLPHTSKIAYHSVNVFQADSRNESVVIDIDNNYDGIAVDQIAHQVVGKHAFAGWPFLREAIVIGISDEERKYVLNETTGAIQPQIHSGDQREKWRRAAGKVEHVYSKRFAVETDRVEVLAHVKLLNGLKRLDDGALVKEWSETEADHAIQTMVLQVSHQDPRYEEKPPMPIEEEFPIGTKTFYLGANSYGTPSIILGHDQGKITLQAAYFLSDRQEPHLFASLASKRLQERYFPSFQVCKQVRMSALALSKLTSGLMMEVSGASGRVNVGLNLKFEAKSQKVLGYAQRSEHGWEFSEKAIALVQEYKDRFPEVIAALDSKRDVTKAADFFSQNTDARLTALKEWIKEKGVRELEKVSLYSDQMEKAAVGQIEELQNRLYAAKSPATMKNTILKNIPRRAALKPEHAASRLQHQRFSVGDRVIMVQESGSVPLAVKGVVVGIQAGFVDVVFDIAFMGGSTLGGRCSQYRGSSVLPSQILNISDMQYVQNSSGQPLASIRPTGASQSTAMNGHTASASSHPSYRGTVHRGHSTPHQHNSTRGRGRGGPVQILNRGDATGKYSAAATGNLAEAYSGPPSQQASLLSNLSGGRYNVAQNNIEGRPPPTQKQNYSSVAPPPELVHSAPSTASRGFRGSRGGIGSGAPRGRGGNVGGNGQLNGHANSAAGIPQASEAPHFGNARGRGSANFRRPRGNVMSSRGRGSHGDKVDPFSSAQQV